jgi:hypothetical protein
MKISETLLKQNVRNGMIHYFEWVSSKNSILDYQTKVPIAFVAAEIFESWHDVHFNSDINWYSEPVFSTKEKYEIEKFIATLEIASVNTDVMIFPLEEILETKVVIDLIHCAESALTVFQKRGEFSNDIEQF